MGASRAVTSPRTPTEPKQRDLADPRSRAGRRAAIVAACAFLVAGAAGLLGGRTATTTVREGPWTLEVTVPAVTRPGTPTSVGISVARDGGLPESVALRLRTAYADSLGAEVPTPSALRVVRGDVWTTWVFDAAGRDELEVTLSGLARWPGSWRVRGVLDVGKTGPRVTWRTIVLP